MLRIHYFPIKRKKLFGRPDNTVQRKYDNP